MNARRIAAMLGKESREILHDPITLGVALAMPPQIQILLDGTYSAIATCSAAMPGPSSLPPTRRRRPSRCARGLVQPLTAQRQRRSAGTVRRHSHGFPAAGAPSVR